MSAAAVSDDVLRELAELRAADRLTAFHVLERAKDPSSALHAHFEWDDTAAARAFRLNQAGMLIVRAKVRIIPREDDGPRLIRAVLEPSSAASFTPAAAPAPAPSGEPSRESIQQQSPQASLPVYASAPAARAASTQRAATPRSVRTTGEDDEIVRGDRPQNDAYVDAIDGLLLLREALSELVGIRRRYAHLTELAPLFAGIDQLAQRVAAPESMRLEKAVAFARDLMSREGLDQHSAAERAAAAHKVSRWDVVDGLRRRAVG